MQLYVGSTDKLSSLCYLNGYECKATFVHWFAGKNSKGRELDWWWMGTPLHSHFPATRNRQVWRSKEGWLSRPSDLKFRRCFVNLPRSSPRENLSGSVEKRPQFVRSAWMEKPYWCISFEWARSFIPHFFNPNAGNQSPPDNSGSITIAPKLPLFAPHPAVRIPFLREFPPPSRSLKAPVVVRCFRVNVFRRFERD